ncbi:MAG: molybdopterin-dependent oxidoreductase [Gammaproteobacteria bacterium]|nr:molybdopterin-dependent oxidoreductase [Gammaproteobacteria bacterium]
MSIELFKEQISRRRMLQVSGATAAAGVTALKAGKFLGFSTLSEAQAAAAAEPQTVVTKSFCHQCPARCGIDVYTTQGRVHAIYGTLDNPLSNGKLCPKGHYGAYILYDADRFKGPMKRTNPRKGRNEDPGFVPISWQEALDTVAARLQALRDRGESHRFGLLFGRGWGATDAGLFPDFAALFGSPNVGINHSSMCSDGSKKAKQIVDGNYSYNAYDYDHTNYILNFGAGFLEAFRPFNANMQVWGRIRTKSPKTRVTVVDVHLNTTGAAADRLLLIKPGTDGALALAIAHVILLEGLWDRLFVGDFVEPTFKFESGIEIDPASFQQKWVHGLPEWWNAVLKDCTPAWAEGITTIPAKDIVAVAREFGSTRPAIALCERGATAHTNGVYNAMAIHSLNALVGSIFAEGGLFYQMKPAYGKLPMNAADFMDDYAGAPERKKPRVDKAKSDDWPMVSNMMQEIARNHLRGEPYKMDTLMFYMTGPVFSAPNPREWERMMAEVFVVDTSPFPSETSHFADIILPDHTYLERLQVAETYPFQGWPMAMIRTPAVKPLYDTMVFGDMLIELGKRMRGPMGEYYKQLRDTENVIKHLAKGFEQSPGDNGVNGFEAWKEKGVWYRKPYHWRQIRGEFYEWDGQGYNRLMTEDQVKEKLLLTPSGRFEFKSGYLEQEKNAKHVQGRHGIPMDRVGYPQYIPARHEGGGDLHFVSPKLALQAEGRSANIPHATAIMQPTVGGKRTVYLEIHPETAARRGIRNGDRVRIKSSVGSIEAVARHYGGIRPDTVALPMIHGHWNMGRWAKDRLPTGSTGEITPNVSDPISGLACYHSAKVSVERA